MESLRQRCLDPDTVLKKSCIRIQFVLRGWIRIWIRFVLRVWIRIGQYLTESETLCTPSLFLTRKFCFVNWIVPRRLTDEATELRPHKRNMKLNKNRNTVLLPDNHRGTLHFKEIGTK